MGCRAFGLGDHAYRVQPLALEPGDRLMFITDGVYERNAADLDLDAVIVQGANAHPREAVRHLITTLLELTGGELNDDATVMCLDWHGGPPRPGSTDFGADR